MRKFASIAAATSLLVTPVLAQSAEAERLPSPIEETEALEAENGILIALLAAAAMIAGIIILSNSDDADDLPTSP